MTMMTLPANALSFIVAAFLVLSVLNGHRRGLVKIILSMSVIIVSMILTNILVDPASAFLRENTNIYETINDSVTQSVDARLEQELEEYGLPVDISDISQMQQSLGIEDIDISQLPDIDVSIDIDSLALPDEMKDMLEDYSLDELTENLDIGSYNKKLSGYITDIVFEATVFGVIYVVVWFVLNIIIKVSDIVTKLPIIHGLNKIGGAIFGFAVGLLYVWIAFALIGISSATDIGSQLMDEIRSTAWLSFLYDINPIAGFIKSVIAAVVAKRMG